jgi:hypothetical protein
MGGTRHTAFHFHNFHAKLADLSFKYATFADADNARDTTRLGRRQWLARLSRFSLSQLAAATQDKA